MVEKNQSMAVGLILIFIIIAGDLITGAVSSHTSPKIGSGTSSCTVAINGIGCTTASIPFSPIYSNTPLIGQVNTTLNPINPSHSLTISGSLASNLITFQSPVNGTLLFYHTESSTTVNIPNVDTILKSFAPAGGQPWPNVIVEGEGYITTSATSTKQVISILVEDCTIPTIFQTITFETESLAIGRTPFAVKGVVPNNALGAGFSCWSIDVSAPAADANTQITLVSMRLYGMEAGFRTWLNMPSATTEIYGTASDEQKYTFVSALVTMTFCVYITTQSTAANAYLSVYVGGVELDAAMRLTVGTAGLGLGLQCNTEAAITLTSGTSIVTVEGNGGAGSGDTPAFGAISLSWSQTSPSQTISAPVGYHIQILSLTPSSFKIRIAFDATVSAGNTVTFNWQSVGS